MAAQIPRARGRRLKAPGSRPRKDAADPELARPRPIDARVGQRIRQRRFLLGMTQQALAKAIGVAFQQVQKYENGTNRVSASRLAQIAETLGVPVAYFFEDTAAGNDSAAGVEDVLTRSETLVLIRSYYAIPDADIRKRVLDLIRSMARTESASDR